MRRLLPLSLLLAACAPLVTPAPYAPAVIRPEQLADAGATLAVAAAGATYAAQQTQTAYTATVQAGAVVGTALAAQAYATRNAVDSQSTQSALTVTAQALQAAQATGTIRAAWATETATAAGPAATATRAAQVVIAERDERGAWAWLIAGVVAVLTFAGGATYAVIRYGRSLGIRQEAEADKIRAQIMPPVIAKQPPAPGLPGYVIVMLGGSLVRQDIPALISAIDNAQQPAQPAPQPAPKIIDVTPGAYMTKRQAEMIAFVKDAQRAAGVTVAKFIPSNDRMGWASTSAWQEHVNVLKALKIAYTDGTGRPAAGEYRTKLADGWSLARLLSELENGQLIISTGETQ